MAQFQFEKSVTDLTCLDGPLQNTPAAQWQKKAQETLLRVHPSDNGVSTPRRHTNTAGRTPVRNPRTPSRSKTPGENSPTPSAAMSKTPKMTPGKLVGETATRSCPSKHLGRTPYRRWPITPARYQDRFIPNRVTTNQDFSHFALMNARHEDDDKDSGLKVNERVSPYVQQLTAAMLPRQAQNGQRILSFGQQCSAQSQPNNLNVLYSTGKVPSRKTASKRYIPSRPENVLDAPHVMDDYYLNTLDWASTGVIAAALVNEVFLWNSLDATITLLMNVNESEYISSVSWIEDGSIIAVGTSDGIVQLWDVNQHKLLRTMSGHSGRVGCLDWNAHILTSGCRSGGIHHHDVRVADHHVATLSRHSEEVCGLRWSPDGKHLASGGNDNIVNIWDTSLGMEVAPVLTFTDHQAAVKAISWCPWQSRLLSTGGGTGDRHIRFWNTNSGTCVKSVDTKSQVCSILWSKNHRELISGHGYSMNQLSLWKYPSMNKITDLVGHAGRILSLCLSPDGQMVASVASDETIRLWKCFAYNKKEKKPKSTPKVGSLASLGMCIR